MMSENESKELIFFLEQVPDPRCRRGIRYRFADLLLMCIYAVLAGHSEATEIEYYVELNFEYFRELLGIGETPSHDTFSRVMRFADFEKLSDSLGEWLRERFPDICERNVGLKILHVDGKASRAASEKSKGEKPVYHLNAMYEGESIGVTVKRVGEKGNEITCLPEYLEKFDLKDTIVTIDAIGCNNTVIKAIQKGGGNYVVPVKENQKRLLQTINKEIERLETTGEIKELDKAEKISKEHGRKESVCMRMIDNTAFIYEELGVESFYGSIARIGIMDKKVSTERDGKEETTENRVIIITDVESMSVENMLKIKAAHWNIEMQHWLLDIQLREDAKTARRDNAVTNGAILRRMCMAVRKYDEKLSEKPMKRFLMANEHDIKRIEGLLFGAVAASE